MDRGQLDALLTLPDVAPPPEADTASPQSLVRAVCDTISGPAKHRCVLAAVMVFIGCDGAPGAPPARTGLYTFPGSSDPVVLEQSEDHVVASLTDLTTWRGDLLIVDAREANVKAYDVETGRLERVVGSRGQGPGEFFAPRGAATLPGDTLVVRDALLQRVSYFDEVGRFVRSWTHSVASTAGIEALPGSDLLIPGRMVADERVVGDSAVHRFSRTGELVRSYLTRNPATHYGESALDAVHVVALDGALLVTQQTTNVMRVVDLDTGALRSDTVGARFYRPIEWSLEPPGEGDEEWVRDQMVAWYLRDLGEDVYAMGFQEHQGEAGEPVLRWVFGTREGPFAESEPTDLRPAFIRRGRLYSVRMGPQGLVELVVSNAPTERSDSPGAGGSIPPSAAKQK